MKKPLVARQALNRFGCLLSVFFILYAAFPVTVLADGVTCSLSQEDCNALFGVYQSYVPDGLCSTATDGSSSPPDVSSVAPGQGAPNGLTYPNLQPQDITKAIDTFIQRHQPNSPLKGTAAFAIASGTKNNVSPFMPYATSLKESSLGVWQDPNSSLKAANNAFGRRASSTQPNVNGWYKWSSIPTSLNKDAPENNVSNQSDWISYVRKVYANELAQGPGAFIMKYAPPSENDTTTYIQQYQGFLNEMARYAGATNLPVISTDIPSASSGSSSCNSSSTDPGTSTGSANLGVGSGRFTDSGSVAHADIVVGNAVLFDKIFGKTYYMKGICATVVSRVWSNGANSWGNWPANGGKPDPEHMYNALKGTSKFHGDRNAKVGAILIYAGNGVGHTTIYLGNNKILNDGFIENASVADSWGGGYVGWVDPNDIGWHTSAATEASLRRAMGA